MPEAQRPALFSSYHLSSIVLLVVLKNKLEKLCINMLLSECLEFILEALGLIICYITLT